MEFDALAPVGALSSGLARRSPVPIPSGERPLLQNPAEVLAALMDFTGSVALAELLEVPMPQGAPHPRAQELARKLHEDMRVRLSNLLPIMLAPLQGRRAPNPPAAAELFTAIGAFAGGAGCVPDVAAAAKLSYKLGVPLQEALRKCLRNAQAYMTALRAELAPAIRDLGPRAQRLEAIDAILARSIAVKQNELFDRVAHAAELTFERACVHACSTLSATYTVEDLASWSAADGWIARYRARCVHITQALFGHLQRSLEGLVMAAIQAEVAA
jgi:hypothetical protein